MKWPVLVLEKNSDGIWEWDGLILKSAEDYIVY